MLKCSYIVRWAAALMMPHSVRADAPLGRGMPILQADRYAIEHIDVSGAELIGGGCGAARDS